MTIPRLQAWHAILAIAAVSFAAVAAEFPAGPWLATAPISLACGVTTLALMAAAAILSARTRLLEGVFGGLDRVYHAHKWFGVAALSFASAHLLFKAGMPDWETAPILELAPDWTRLIRQASFVGLMLIVLLSLNRKISYSDWRWWHRLSGPIFIVVVLHALSIKSPVALASPAGVWLSAMATLAIAAATYRLAIYPFLAQRAEYHIVGVSPAAGAVRIDLEPAARGISFTPGQFGFLSIKAEGLREPHPFTIAAAPGGRISFVIRALGDFTAKLISEAAVGMRADVYAPYGRFVRRADATREIWIAGGVGISPFIAWMKDRKAGGFARVTLFYLFTPGRAFPHVEELAATAEECGVEFTPIDAGPASPAFADRFDDIIRHADPAGLDIALCGPKGLLDAVRKRMAAAGAPARSLRYEIFEFR